MRTSPGSLSALVVLALFGSSAESAPVTIKPTARDSDEVKKLLVQRRDVLVLGVKVKKEAYDAGRLTLDDLQQVSKQLLEAELELVMKAADRIAAHQRRFKLAYEVEEVVTARYKAGRESVGNLYQARADRLAAEIALRRAGGEPPAGTRPPEKLADH
jgi:outer membrane PBP1 activator LpoA protein